MTAGLEATLFGMYACKVIPPGFWPQLLICCRAALALEASAARATKPEANFMMDADLGLKGVCCQTKEGLFISSWNDRPIYARGRCSSSGRR